MIVQWDEGERRILLGYNTGCRADRVDAHLGTSVFEFGFHLDCLVYIHIPLTLRVLSSALRQTFLNVSAAFIEKRPYLNTTQLNGPYRILTKTSDYMNLNLSDLRRLLDPENEDHKIHRAVSKGSLVKKTRQPRRPEFSASLIWKIQISEISHVKDTADRNA